MPTNRRCRPCCPSGTLHVANAANALRPAVSTSSISTSVPSSTSPHSTSSCFQWPDFLMRDMLGNLREQIGRHTHFQLGHRHNHTRSDQQHHHLLDQSPSPYTGNNARSVTDIFGTKLLLKNCSSNVEHFLLTPASSNFDQSFEVRFESHELLQPPLMQSQSPSNVGGPRRSEPNVGTSLTDTSTGTLIFL